MDCPKRVEFASELIGNIFFKIKVEDDLEEASRFLVLIYKTLSSADEKFPIGSFLQLLYERATNKKMKVFVMSLLSHL